jgi:hypothetical protein
VLKLKRYYSTQSKLAGISNHLEEGWKTVLFFFGNYKLTHLKRWQGTPGYMALWNRPCLVPLVPQEGFGFKPHWCAGESLAGPLPVSLAWVPTTYQVLGWLVMLPKIIIIIIIMQGLVQWGCPKM